MNDPSAVGTKAETETEKETQETAEATAGLLKKLEALRTLGFVVPVRYEGLRSLAVVPPIGHKLLRTALEVLDPKRKKKERYYPIMDHLMIERSILEPCFPDVESSVPEHMRDAPDWLLESPIEG